MDISFYGIPKDIDPAEAATFRSRVLKAYSDLSASCNTKPAVIAFGTKEEIQNIIHPQHTVNGEDTNPNSFHGLVRSPSFSFDQLILPDEIRQEIEMSIQLMQVESKVFDEWGLRSIEPNPKTALNFYGPPGTGKTLAAHAIASYLRSKILVASYAEIESKYHGDGPKNVKALFAAAEHEKAVLFIDEADSLLSKRLTNVSQGSEQAINSMRSQLLINMELFHGIVIFSTNLIQNYDKAFETRIRHIHFPMPDLAGRKKIWEQHLVPNLPISEDVSAEKLADEFDNVCGRDIKNAVIQAAVKAAVQKQCEISYSMFAQEIKAIIASRQKTSQGEAEGRPCTEDEKKELTLKIREKIKNGEVSFDQKEEA